MARDDSDDWYGEDGSTSSSSVVGIWTVTSGIVTLYVLWKVGHLLYFLCRAISTFVRGKPSGKRGRRPRMVVKQYNVPKGGTIQIKAEKHADYYYLDNTKDANIITCTCAEWAYCQQCRHVDIAVLVEGTENAGVKISPK